MPVAAAAAAVAGSNNASAAECGAAAAAGGGDCDGLVTAGSDTVLKAELLLWQVVAEKSLHSARCSAATSCWGEGSQGACSQINSK
jgi:hypothetical protein